MRVLIIGRGPVAYYLSRHSRAKGHEVTLVVRERDEAEDLARRLEGVTVVEGDGTDPALLRELEAEGVDVVVALCPRDEDNLIVCQVARRFFSVPRTVSLVNDPSNRELFEALGVSPTVSQAEVLGVVIEQESEFSGITSGLTLAEGRVSVLEVRLDHDAPAVGRTLSQLALPDGALVAAVLREGGMRVPRGTMSLVAGDELLLVSQPERTEEALERLVGRRQA